MVTWSDMVFPPINLRYTRVSLDGNTMTTMTTMTSRKPRIAWNTLEDQHYDEEE
jgi:hypothetical protein